MKFPNFLKNKPFLTEKRDFEMQNNRLLFADGCFLNAGIKRIRSYSYFSKKVLMAVTVSSLITCSMRQASLVAVSPFTPMKAKK